MSLAQASAILPERGGLRGSLSDTLWRKPTVLLVLLLTPPVLWLGIVYLGSLFALLLHDCILSAVPDAFFSPAQSAPLDLCHPNFYDARKVAIDARLDELAAATPTRLAEMVRRGASATYKKAICFLPFNRQPPGRQPSPEAEEQVCNHHV